MWQEIARLKLDKIKAAQTGTLLQGVDVPANFRIGLYGSISASPSSKTAALAGTVGFKVSTSDNFGGENDVSLDLVSSTVAGNSFAIGILESGTNIPIVWSVKVTSNFPTDCYFTIFALLEQDVEQFPSI